jgi:hypothetical protein
MKLAATWFVLLLHLAAQHQRRIHVLRQLAPLDAVHFVPPSG